jgi:uncharacterized protein (TIRG00374 family)
VKVFRVLLPGLGLLLLGYLVGTLGHSDILHNLGVMRWAFLHVLLLACGWHVTNSIAWSFAFPAGAFRPRLRSLFMSKLAGEAVNQLTPLANLGGEPLKAYLLRHQAPTSRGLASVVINKTGQVFAGLVFTAVGLSLVILYWEVPQALPMPVRGGLAVLFATAATLLYVVYRKQRHMFSSLLGFVRRFGVRLDSIDRRMTKAVRIDENISRFYRQNKGRFALVLGFHACGWMLGACETYVILRALGAGIDFEIAFLITSLTVIINSLFFFMPSNIGVLEGGQVFLFLTLGLDPAMGLSLGIVKRMRKIFWISVGWLFLTHLSRSLGRSALPEGELFLDESRSADEPPLQRGSAR